MLIHALCKYYDILAKAERVLPDGYSNVKVHYLVSLTSDGSIDEIINCQVKEVQQSSKGKAKEIWLPKDMRMPQRTEKPGIDANIIEHRPLYLFGLNMENDALSPDDRTDKARKSHEAFVRANLEFIEGLDFRLIHAYRMFLQRWRPEEETQNEWLTGLGKNYGKSGFAFCLSGYPEQLLHEDPQVIERWDKLYRQLESETPKEHMSQCAVEGKKAAIARIHNKIKGVYGGLATGTVLVGYNNPSENSYGNEQSYNSNISEDVMKKYTEALNYLLGSRKHKMLLDDMTVVFWAMAENENCEDFIMAMLCGQTEQMNAEQTERMFMNLIKDGKKGKITEGRLQSLDIVQPEVDFYMVGLKPNSSRLAIKFVYRKKYAEVLWNIARFQKDLQISNEIRPVSLSRVKAELVSPKSKNDVVSPALIAKILDAIVRGGRYPESLLETVVRRIKTDKDMHVNEVRAGLVKACINRNYQKEELNVALDKENRTPAYLCGRLFAVLERLQQDASNNSLNRTIKDAYFASASSKPAIVFPKLLKLAQNHLNKVKAQVFYNKLIGEIIEPLAGEFPETLLLTDQGRFIIGYYQQRQSFYEKKEIEKLENEEEESYGN